MAQALRQRRQPFDGTAGKWFERVVIGTLILPLALVWIPHHGFYSFLIPAVAACSAFVFRFYWMWDKKLSGKRSKGFMLPDNTFFVVLIAAIGLAMVSVVGIGLLGGFPKVIDSCDDGSYLVEVTGQVRSVGTGCLLPLLAPWFYAMVLMLLHGAFHCSYHISGDPEVY